MKLLQVLLAGLLLAAIIAGTVMLPKIREDRWENAKRGTQPTKTTAIEQPADEADVIAASAIDTSTFDQRMDLRKIRSIPESTVELEAAFRQRKNDDCEALSPGESLELSQFTTTLTPRDTYREEATLASTRREVLTIGLNLLPVDYGTLPTLSRSTILSFLKSHYVSLQARVLKDPLTQKLSLHYRPLAAIGKMGGIPLTQEWVEAIQSTVHDIRGLGLFENSDKSAPSHTAVYLFRSAWLDESGAAAGIRHELAMIHALPTSASGKEIDLHVFTTANLRQVWHYFPPRQRRRPARETDCDMLGIVRFEDFSHGGLQPKSSVTRKITTRSSKSFDVQSLDRYLKENNAEGPWQRNLDRVLNAIVDGNIKPNLQSDAPR